MDLGVDGAVTAAKEAAASGMNWTSLAKQFGPTVARMALAAVAGGADSGGSGAGTGTGTADIDSLISGALGNTEAMQKWYAPKLDWATGQVEKIAARGDAGYDQLMEMSRAPNRNIDDYQQYLDRIGSQGYRDQQRGSAMGEVQQQSDMGLAQARRAAMARGVDPSKFALQQNANSINAAAAKTKAAADAEGMAWDQWGKGSQIGAGMRMDDGNYRMGLVRGANELGQSGLNAGLKLATVDGAYRGGMNNSYMAMAGAKNDVARTQLGINAANTAQDNYNRENSLGSIVGAKLTSNLTDWAFGNGKTGGGIGNFFGSFGS
jgi:hypothetical protein